ncbi:MAG: thioredoxin family protein [Candidatus Marinimicrobia bacterium]|nr:thioredoxin family protein [Candidatus Neomarinimicrobiota bacterium]
MKKIECQEFDTKVLQKASQVVVLFSTDWSGSSLIVRGALHELEEEFGDKISFIEIDREQCQQICQDYGIKKVPTILFFKEGGVVEQLNGVPSKNTIHKILRKIN